MTKAEWLEEGKALGARASESGWELGKWLVQGEEQFIGPVPSSKKAKRTYFANLRANRRELYREAATVTNLKDTTLHQYARVVRHCVRVNGLSIGHHIEAQRARTMQYVNPKRGKELRFDHQAARDLLNLAKDKGWSVAETRKECSRRFPRPKAVETVLEKMKRTLKETLRTVDDFYNRLEFLDGLAAELSQIREQVSLEWDADIQRILSDDDCDDPDHLNHDFAL